MSRVDPKFEVDVAQFHQAFLAEARELIEGFESTIIQLEQSPEEQENIHDVFRKAHSIKGAAATAGRTGLAAFTHDLETMLDAWRSGKLAVDAQHFNALYESVDVLQRLITDESPDALARAQAIAKVLRDLCAMPEKEADGAGMTPEVAVPTAGGSYRARVRLQHDAYQCGGDPLLSIRELLALCPDGTVTLDDSQLPALSALVAEEAYFSYVIDLPEATELSRERIIEAFAFFEGVATIEIEEPSVTQPQQAANRSAADDEKKGSRRSTHPQEAGAGSRQHEPATIRVATEKIDRVIDLVGELVIAHSALRELTRDHRPDRAMALTEAVLVAERHLRELQERVMAVRMIPVGTMFARLPRMVRDIATKLGKDVALVVEGAETELDKTLIEKLIDPLMHLVRNALDHGVEAPEKRLAAGKPQKATLAVRGYARSGSVFVEVEDDGGGIDVARVREKAIERGWLAPDQPLADEDAFKLLCHPGFSTKTEVSDVSGRGVGLDVVQKNMEALNGALHVSSTLGHGTRFTLRLPLTLTIVDGLMVSTSGGACVLPLSDVSFSLRIRPGQVRKVVGAGDVLDLANETVPLVDLGEALGRAPANGGGQLAVVVRAGHHHYALRVDALLGQAQTVVKSLETHYRRVPGVMGATILGDGKVALILDGQGLAVAAGLNQRTDLSAIASTGSNPWTLPH